MVIPIQCFGGDEMRSKASQVAAGVAFTAVIVLAQGAYAKTETSHVERSFAAKPGGTVTVDVSFHQVEVTARPGDTVDVTVDLQVSASASKAQRLLKEWAPVFEERGKDIRIRSRRKGRGGLFDWGSTRTKGRVEVAMPPGMHLVVDASSGSCRLNGDFGDVKVVCDVSSGSVKVEGAMRELIADASSGSVNALLTRPVESVDVDTSSGSVSLEGPVTSTRVNTSSGSIEVAGLVGEASLDASSGSITASWDRIDPGTRVNADTSSGGVRLHFPPGTVLSGTASTSSGGIRSDFEGERSRRGDEMRFRGGEGAVRLSVSTSSGGVRILQR
jgi:hypothetical protein